MNRRLTLTFAFNYGGRAEIVDAVRAIARKRRGGRLDPDQIDERTIARHLYAPDMPDPDLLVRTSGEYRISNYLLWELATPSSCSPTSSGPTSAARTSSTRSPSIQRRDRRFGAI